MQIAIDLGNSSSAIYKKGSGIVLSEPSVVAVDSSSGSIKAIGADAKRLVGKTAENTAIVFPIYEGEIVNEQLAATMLSHFLKKTDCKRVKSALFCVPCGIDALSLDKYRKLAALCNIKRAVFVIEPILSALGQNVALNEFSPCFAINIGGGVTNIAAFTLDGVIAGISMNIGGGNIDAHIIDHIAEKSFVKIGLLTAERLKINAGSLLEGDRTAMAASGRDVTTGKPRSVNISADYIFEPISIYIDKIIEYAIDLLSKLPAEVLAEIRQTGLFLSGGCAKFAGTESYFSKKLGMSVHIADPAELAAVSGSGYCLSNPTLLERVRLRLS